MRTLTAVLLTITGLALAQSAWSETREQLAQQVRDAENGFAGTMAARDFKAFQSMLRASASVRSIPSGAAQRTADGKSFSTRDTTLATAPRNSSEG